MTLTASPVAQAVIGAAIEVHRQVGPGLLESAYHACLCYELSSRGTRFQQQVRVPVRYRDVTLDCGFRADLIVEEEVLVELKSVDRLLPVHDAQLITYLKLTRLPQGLLINFHAPRLVDGLRSRLNTSVPTASGQLDHREGP